MLTDQQFAKLNNLAFQAAVTKICDGYNLDDKKFADGMAEATKPADASLSADDQKQWGTAVLIRPTDCSSPRATPSPKTFAPAPTN